MYVIYECEFIDTNISTYEDANTLCGVKHITCVI